MKTYDDENIQKYVKSIDNIDNTKLSKWCCGYEGEWRYFGECDKNDKPFGIGRAIAKDKPMLVESYFKNGQCHGLARTIAGWGMSAYSNLKDGVLNGKEI